MSNLIEIHFDGGCRPTNPGNKYGSYEITLNGNRVHKVSREEFGWGTNNEAEFDALIKALGWMDSNIKTSFNPKDFSVKMYTDSTIVRNRIANRNGKSKGSASRRMSVLTQKCLSYLGQYGFHDITWNGRSNNVERFGH